MPDACDRRWSAQLHGRRPTEQTGPAADCSQALIPEMSAWLYSMSLGAPFRWIFSVISAFVRILVNAGPFARCDVRETSHAVSEGA